MIYYEKMEALKDILLQTQKVCTWCLSQQGELLYTNCSSGSFYYDLFSISACRSAVTDHFNESTKTLMAIDRIGFAWLAMMDRTAQDTADIYMLGPVFTAEATEDYIRSLCRTMKISPPLSETLLKKIKDIPHVSSTAMQRLGGMMKYCIDGTTEEKDTIASFIEQSDVPQERSQWIDTNYHGTWEAEHRFFRSLIEGNCPTIEEMSSGFASGNVGKMASDDPLRQAKNETLVMIALICRAAILAGVSPEGSYNIADTFIQLTEACSTISAVTGVAAEAYNIYVLRIRSAKKDKGLSAAVAACRQYVATHICEKISLSDMAAHIGYTEYYLSRKYKEETGMSINDYIKQEKIETAKMMLKSKGMSFAEIADRLAFSSPSYFSAVFRQYTGMTPMEYQNGGK